MSADNPESSASVCMKFADVDKNKKVYTGFTGRKEKAYRYEDNRRKEFAVFPLRVWPCDGGSDLLALFV